jgi:serine/threonine protein kinase
MKLPEEPTQEFPFQIDKTIGEGSMGVVVRARERNLDRPVAIKVLRPDFLNQISDEAAQEASRRFLQEARTSASISHPGIVTIHRLGHVDGLSYIAMEWIDGEPLSDLVRNHAPLPISEACDITRQLLDALQVAHEHDIVHRDVKPANVLIRPDGQIKLTDFGIAHVKHSDLVRTQAGQVLGTPLYSSPEQLLERGVDGRTDVFAAGVMLYEMLTGQPPFEGDNLASVSTKIVNETPESVQSRNPQVPDDLSAVVHQALAKEPSRRFSSADAMRTSLESACTDDLSSLEAPSWVEDGTLPQGLDEGTSKAVPTVILDANIPADLPVELVLQWPADSLGETDPHALLEKLLDTPLHTEPFAGGARIGDALFLIYQGLIFASIDLARGKVSNHVYDQLPNRAAATIYSVPDHLSSRIIPHLASSLYEPELVHKNLDSSFTNIPNLVNRLQSENFDGAVQLRDGSDFAYLYMEDGSHLLELFSDGWDPSPTEQPWQTWINDRSVTVNVERRQTHFPSVTYRRELDTLRLDVSPASDEQRVDHSSSESTIGVRYSNWKIQPLADHSDEDGHRDSTIWRDLYRGDPMFKLLEWMVASLPEHMDARKRFDRWKYLTHWIAEISSATLYEQLPRPNSRESDDFDLVTRDDDRKVLHVAQRVSRLSADHLDTFVSSVKRAKTARNDRGDIGAALLVAPSIDDSFHQPYADLTADSSSWMDVVTESFTGYEGFVRTGMRRGFHLLPVVEQGGDFKPVLDLSA